MSSERLRILAVDDEHSQLEDLARLLRSSEEVEEVECAFGGREALNRLSAERFDAIFLDVRMPDLPGLELARVLRRFATPPELVFVSAYDSAAVEAFELHALDYLRKPVSHRRVEEALARVVDAIELHNGSAEAARAGKAAPVANADMVAVSASHNGAVRLLARDEILYAQAQGDYARVVTTEGRYLLRTTLSELEEQWRPAGFVRVHRQYLANLPKAVELRPQIGGTAELAFRDGQTVPIARRHIPDLARRLRL